MTTCEINKCESPKLRIPIGDYKDAFPVFAEASVSMKDLFQPALWRNQSLRAVGYIEQPEIALIFGNRFAHKNFLVVG